jgi:hypothetical protein
VSAYVSKANYSSSNHWNSIFFLEWPIPVKTRVTIKQQGSGKCDKKTSSFFFASASFFYFSPQFCPAIILPSNFDSAHLLIVTIIQKLISIYALLDGSKFIKHF